ncbi:MAG TPA: hypothetical protein VK403_01475 [Allosphingosinicella sp.]|nr:hypothetical protein [Allosphingosinicella sp.]
MIRTIAALLMLALGSACAQLPKPELQAYSTAFEATRSAAEPMLADYAIAERDVRLGLMQTDTERSYDGFFPTFRASDAAAVSTVGLPPGAEALDRTFRAIGHYNETLVALAENRNIDEARGQVSQIIDELGGIAPPLAQSPAVKPIADLLITALTPAIAADNREQFKRIVLSGEPHVQALISALRDYTPTQYSITTSALRKKARLDPPPSDQAEVVAKINSWHKAFADYVALLDAMKLRLSDLRAAVENPRAAPILQRAATGAAGLRSYADALRLSLARVRAQP